MIKVCWISHYHNLMSEFGPLRMLFRTGVVATLLVLGISLPDFSSILDLIGASTITCLNFIFPPIFFMFLADQAKKNTKWEPRRDVYIYP